MDLQAFRKPPFSLDDQALAWVAATFASLSQEEQIGQILLPLWRDLGPDSIERLVALQVGGVHRLTARTTDELRRSAARLQASAKVPLLITADLECSEKGRLLEGTGFPNQLGVAATGDLEQVRRMARVAAREGRYTGANWSFTPVVDINFNRNSSVVNTRSFGSDPDWVAACAQAYVETLQAEGLAASAKHFPGDGVDDRDQHLVTSENRLTMAAWRATYGRVYRAVIAAGVKTIMTGHIALPAYAEERGLTDPRDRRCPGTLSRAINLDLLRGELGFNGLIVSDAIQMGGFNGWGPMDDLVPQCLASGCDIILFPYDVPVDIARIKAALADGRLSPERLRDAVLRVLAFKASIGLHHGAALPAESEAPALFAGAAHQAWAAEAAAAGLTLVQDDQALLPLDPVRHRRLLLCRQPQRRNASNDLPALIVPDLLAARGFEVTIYQPGLTVSPEEFDAMIYVIGEEGGSARQRLLVDWATLHADYFGSMQRFWHHVPTAFISFGNPYHLYELPECRTYINAYSPLPLVQQALVEALTGVQSFPGKSPVDPTGERESRFLRQSVV